MSAVKLCRLCLNNDRLIHMFDARLNSQQQLLTCILLGTGVDIRPDDVVSKHVCHNCCIISVKLFKYRQNAIACDKALKEFVNQKSEDRPFIKEEIAELNRSLVEGLSKIEPNWTSEDYSESVPAPAPDASNEAPIIKSKSTRGISAVHPSVRRLFRRHPKIVIPNAVLPFDIEAVVVLKNDRDRVYGAVPQVKVERSERGTVAEADLEAIDRLKQACPSLNITRIKTSASKDGEEESPGTSKLRRTPAKRRRSSGSDEQETKQKRASLAPPSEEVKCTSSFTKSDSSVEDHNHFSVANDSGSPPAPSTSANNDPETDENNEANRTVSLCKSCGRIYDCEDELRQHENRMHPVCHVCKEKQKSPAALSMHLSEVCYKNIEANQPKLELVRVDEVPELREKYKDVLVYHPNTTEGKDVNDDDPVEVVNEFDYLSELEFCEEETSGEREFLARIFSKYRGNAAVMKSKHTGMQMSDIKIRYDAKNRIIIENIYSDLKIFKVPLNLKVSATVGAHVSIAPKVIIDDVKDTWDSTGAIDIKPKFMSLHGCVVTNSMGVSSVVVTEAARVPGSMQPNIVVFQPPMVAQAPGPQNVVVRPSTSSSADVTGGVGKPPNVLRKIYRPVMLKKVHTGAGSSVINVRELFVPKKAPATLSTPPQLAPLPITKIIVNASQPNQTKMRLLAPAPPALTLTPPANQAEPPKQRQTLLRVRAPWEINSQL